MLGVGLVDSDVFNVPLLVTDPYGYPPRRPHGFPMAMLANGVHGGGVESGARRFRAASLAKTNHQFLNDIAHSAAPTAGGPDADTTIGASLDTPVPRGPTTTSCSTRTSSPATAAATRTSR